MANEPGKTSWKLSGDPVSSGIAVGEAFIFRHINLDALEKTRFPVDDVAKESQRLDGIIHKTVGQLREIIDQKDLAGNVSEIFQVQLRILQDAGFLQELRSLLDAQRVNIEYVLSNQIKVIEQKFQALENELLRTRFIDIQDVYFRILRNCLDIEHVRSNPFKRLQRPVIFIARKLLPSDLALLDYDKLLGILMEEGSSVSHVAIIAKSLGIPAIIKIPGISSIVRAHDTVIMDAYKGIAIVNPSDSILATYAQREQAISSARPKTVRHRKIAECTTTDGVAVTLEANIGSLKEAQEALENGASGIGLLRSELFYLSRTVKPTVEEESDYYAAVLSLFKNRPVTVRLLDLGADKTLPYLPTFEEANPQMGIRGIRYLLRNRELFRDHAQSIIRASAQGRLNMLIPFVATENDVVEALREIDDLCAREGVDRKLLRTGIMVEIPSAALSLSRFWPFIDFVNIGTNDLAQYLFAASREDANVEQYRQKSHPVILNILAHCAASGRRAQKGVSVCGELAADPQGALLLVGLGVRSLSMQPSSLPPVRKALNKSSLKGLQKLAKKTLAGHDLHDKI